jgi:translation initiation factor 2 beta subunit (eIF-2beta)/eIF-5
MEIRATLSEPSVKREGDKWILSFDEFDISDFSERDMPVFERLYELGWRPDKHTFLHMCKKLPAEFILKHEPKERVVELVRERLLECHDCELARKFAGLFTHEEKRAMIQEKIERYRSNYDWCLRDYGSILSLIETFPEVVDLDEIPELKEQIVRDLSRWEKWIKHPLAYGYETYDTSHFREGLEAVAKLKELVVLPQNLEQLAREVVAKICGTLVRRLTSKEIKDPKAYVDLAKVSLALADDDTKARILSALLEMGNNGK